MQLGDRVKQLYEKAETSQKFVPLLPIYCRIDGRSFSKFTKGMAKPYEERMSRVMQEVTKFLVKETSARVGYTQSDEISLLFYVDDIRSSIFFDGKKQKMVSVLAAAASAKFMQVASAQIPEFVQDKVPMFDARVFNVPNKTEAMNCFLWRVQDAVKNSISMAARSVFSHREVNNKNQSQMLDMLLEKGINWNDYPKFFKEGSFFQRIQYEKEPGVIRSRIDEILVGTKFEDLSTEERIKVLFGGKE